MTNSAYLEGRGGGGEKKKSKRNKPEQGVAAFVVWLKKICHLVYWFYNP